jgi:hypothetical protein
MTGLLPLVSYTFPNPRAGEAKESEMTRTARFPARARTLATARWRRAGPAIVVLAAAAALVAACGSGGSQDAASSSANGTSAQSSARQSGIIFVSCIRAHGVPSFPSWAVTAVDGQFEMHVPGYFKSEPQFQSALQACQRDLPGGGASAKHFNIPEELNFARCMRSHGITWFPDPLPSGRFDIMADTTSPQFEAAARACQSTGVHWNSAP